MTNDKMRNLAIEYGGSVTSGIDPVFAFSSKELAAYTAEVEEPLQARIAQLEAAFYINMIRAFPNKTHQEISDEISTIGCSSSTWLSEHDKEVEARERERCAVLCEGMYGALRGECAAAIRELK